MNLWPYLFNASPWPDRTANDLSFLLDELPHSREIETGVYLQRISTVIDRTYDKIGWLLSTNSVFTVNFFIISSMMAASFSRRYTSFSGNLVPKKSLCSIG